jgi:hypothetical protein
METLEYVRAYFDDLLHISKLSLEYHLEKLEAGNLAIQDKKSMQQNQHSAHLK